MYWYFTFRCIQFFKHFLFLRAKKYESLSFLIVTSCTTNPMDVSFNAFWAVNLQIRQTGYGMRNSRNKAVLKWHTWTTQSTFLISNPLELISVENRTEALSLNSATMACWTWCCIRPCIHFRGIPGRSFLKTSKTNLTCKGPLLYDNKFNWKIYATYTPGEVK